MQGICAIHAAINAAVTPPEIPADFNTNPAMHGQKKDGMIFINGFSWIVDEGGGGIGEPAPDMYENGNK